MRFFLFWEARFYWRNYSHRGGGSAQSVNVSSSGAYFICKDPPAVGSEIYVEVAWPKLLHGDHRMKLKLRGFVIRRGESGVDFVVRIDKYGFSTFGTGLSADASKLAFKVPVV